MRNPQAASGTDTITGLVNRRARQQIAVSDRHPPADIHNIFAPAHRALAYFFLVFRHTKGSITALAPEPLLIERYISTLDHNRQSLNQCPGKLLSGLIINT